MRFKGDVDVEYVRVVAVLSCCSRILNCGHHHQLLKPKPYSYVIKTNRLFSYVIKWNLRSYRLYNFQQLLYSLPSFFWHLKLKSQKRISGNRKILHIILNFHFVRLWKSPNQLFQLGRNRLKWNYGNFLTLLLLTAPLCKFVL